MENSLRRSAALAVVALCTTLTLFGCGADKKDSGTTDVHSSSPTAPHHSPAVTAPDNVGESIDPTTVVTLDDVRDVLGAGFSLTGKSEKAVDSSGERNASYEDGSRTVMVQTQIDDQSGGTIWQAIVDSARNGSVGIDPYYAPIMNVGDAAFIGSYATISVHKGTTVVEINFLGEETTDTTSRQLTDLARLAMKHVK